MPFTPFHLGPGLLFKASSPRRFSFLAFACTQVVIDLETLINLLRRRWPVHRFLHSIPGAIIVGLLTAVVLGAASHRISDMRRFTSLVPGELHWPALCAGGVVGGASHSVLDWLMRSDVRLLYPLETGRALSGSLGAGSVHLGCILSAVAGMALLGFRYYRERVAG